MSWIGRTSILNGCGAFTGPAVLCRPGQTPCPILPEGLPPVAREKNLRADQTVRLKTKWSRKLFAEPLRRITVYDPEHKISLVLLHQ